PPTCRGWRARERLQGVRSTLGFRSVARRNLPRPLARSKVRGRLHFWALIRSLAGDRVLASVNHPGKALSGSVSLSEPETTKKPPWLPARATTGATLRNHVRHSV